ncbi:hypothetical protein CBR_g4249 [Chara braunii]|uniref:CCHC-type domain-containing protein n=1 Tax=Chara braunii TaxID=69332 RepID=A0A388JR59_CHABU|nr:hypothetical protein CBR_g4249 [Chara braunii]|eukprot:GBG60294.1 hypothetical protein CBR_g4249 [Chara braunii]
MPTWQDLLCWHSRDDTWQAGVCKTITDLVKGKNQVIEEVKVEKEEKTKKLMGDAIKSLKVETGKPEGKKVEPSSPPKSPRGSKVTTTQPEKPKKKEKVKMKLPFKFENLLLWIAEIQTYCSTAPVEPESQVAFSTSCLRGEAKEWVMAEANATGFDDIGECVGTLNLKQFLGKIKERFLDKTTIDKAFDQLTTIGQKHWTSVESLLREVDRLLQVPRLNLQDNQVLYIYSRALPEPIHGQLMAESKSGTGKRILWRQKRQDHTLIVFDDDTVEKWPLEAEGVASNIDSGKGEVTAVVVNKGGPRPPVKKKKPRSFPEQPGIAVGRPWEKMGLSQETWQERMDNAQCLKCGTAGHAIAWCPLIRKILKASVLSMQAYMKSKMDAMQDTLDQILQALQRLGIRTAALPLLPLSAMTGPYVVQSGQQPSGTLAATLSQTVASSSSGPATGATSQSPPVPPAGQQLPWYPKIPLKPPPTFSGDKKDEALDTWLRTVPVWVRAKRTLVEEEVITIASYLEGSAARWLNGLVASKGFGRNMGDWAQTHTLESFMDLVEARWHNPQQGQIATDGLLKLDSRKYKSVRELTTTVERLIVIPGVEYDPQVLLTMFLRCLPTDIKNLLASEARLEYHTFETFSKKALDLEVTLALEDLQGEWSARDPRESWVALSRGPRGEHFVVEAGVGGRKCGAFVDIGSTRSFISRDCVDRLHLKDRVKCLSRPVASTLANKERMMVEDYVKDVICTFSYPGGEINHKISLLVSDNLPFDMLLGMYYLEAARPQFEWDKKVLKHELPNGRTVRLARYKASRLIDSYGCLCASAFYNYYKQNQEEGMYLVYVSAKGEAVKRPPEIETIVAKYPDLLEEPTEVVDKEVVHEIIPGSKTPKGRIYRMALVELDELRGQLKELTEKCYRGLNAITVKNAEPLPRIDDLLDRVQGYYLGALIYEFGLSEDVTRSLRETYKEDPITMDIINKLQAKDKATSDEFVMVDGLLFLEKAGFKRHPF